MESWDVEFIEAAVFTRSIQRFGLEEPLALLQQRLAENPAAGVIDAGTGGTRKIRMADPGRGRALAANPEPAPKVRA